MNQKELGEIRRRFTPQRAAISHIYGCYVNTAKNVVARFSAPVSLMDEDERERWLLTLRGALAGTLGKNLLAVPFSAQDVTAAEGKHRLISDLRRTGLTDEETRERFYKNIIANFEIEDTNYVILLTDDAYDVPRRGKNGDADGSDTVFHYILCAVCPVKEMKRGLGYDHTDQSFHTTAISHVVGAPALGFLFPSFDGRAANLYAALYYSRDAGEIHPEFVDAAFGVTAPMSAKEQKDAFSETLAVTLGEDCSFGVVQAVHGSLREKLALHKESRDPEPLELTPEEVGDVLSDSGVDAEKVQAFRKECAEKFGGDVLPAVNLMDTGRFRLQTTEAKITVSPDAAGQIEVRVIDGKKYILIPAESGVEINGMNVKLP